MYISPPLSLSLSFCGACTLENVGRLADPEGPPIRWPQEPRRTPLSPGPSREGRGGLGLGC